MPQITCPKCGVTINLENRRKIDFSLILSEVKRKPKTFTELLKITNLPRKTLSLRLKELRENGVLVKDGRVYKLNDPSGFNEFSVKKFSRIFYNDRQKVTLALVILLICFSASGYVLAKFLTSPKLHDRNSSPPPIIGTFTMDIYVMDVSDLHSWQVAVTYNSSQLKVLRITPGGFIGTEFAKDFAYSTDTRKDLLLLAGWLFGDAPGKNGSGKLATVTFGYFTEEYEKPQLVLNNEPFFGTKLIDSNGLLLEIHDGTIKLIFH